MKLTKSYKKRVARLCSEHNIPTNAILVVGSTALNAKGYLDNINTTYVIATEEVFNYLLKNATTAPEVQGRHTTFIFGKVRVVADYKDSGLKATQTKDGWWLQDTNKALEFMIDLDIPQHAKFYQPLQHLIQNLSPMYANKAHSQIQANIRQVRAERAAWCY